MSEEKLLSILCPCYNHEKYISYFISSVLSQKYRNFELIIVDDCSSDSSINIIRSFRDSRIRLIKQEYNKGVNEALNTAFKYSSGKFIIICASDDCFENDALNIYADAFLNNPQKIIYTNLNVIDENNVSRDDYEKSSLPLLHQRKRTEFLHDLFYIGNKLYSPGMALSRDILKRIMPLPASNSIYQDYKMHIELLSLYDLKIMKKKLIKYRIPYKGNHLSINSEKTQIRTRLEEDSLMDSFILIKDISLLQNMFLNEIIDTNIYPIPQAIEFFLGRMALHKNMKNYQRRLWGIRTIMNFYNIDYNRELLKKEYNFNYSDLIQLTNALT